MKKFIWAIIVAVFAINGGSVYADSITATLTGDNNISYWNGSSWTAAGNNWQNAESYSINVNSKSYFVYLAVSNDYTSPANPADGGNPAGFLASFTDNNGTLTQTGTNSILSNSSTVDLKTVPGWINPLVEYPTIPTPSQYNPPSSLNPTLLSGWVPSTDIAQNGSGPWGGSLLGTINSNADWVWTANDNGFYAQEDDGTIFEINLGVTDGSNAVVPEPPTVLLLAFEGALLLFFNRRKMLQVV